MKDSESLHLKVQEHIDCFATSDPLKQMSEIQSEAGDAEEAAVKWLALAVLHGVNQNAEKITVYQNEDKSVSVMAEYRKVELPSPGNDIGARILQAVREIAHAENDKEKTLFSVGLRGEDVTLKVKMKSKDGGEKVAFKFPKGKFM